MSFLAPYYCPSCDRGEDKLLGVDRLLGEEAIVAPRFACGVCGKAMEFDDFEESYFAFVRAMKPDAIDASLQTLVEGASNGFMDKLTDLSLGGVSQLSGPVEAIAAATPAKESDRFPGLIASAGQAARASGGPAGASPQQLRALATPATNGTQRGPIGTQPQVTSKPPGLRNKTTLSAASVVIVLLIAFSLVVVLVLTYLVLTIQ